MTTIHEEANDRLPEEIIIDTLTKTVDLSDDFELVFYEEGYILKDHEGKLGFILTAQDKKAERQVAQGKAVFIVQLLGDLQPRSVRLDLFEYTDFASVGFIQKIILERLNTINKRLSEYYKNHTETGNV